MAFLDNSGDIILDAVLTDTGRLRLAQGDGSFKISKFALGDDEINYELYDKNHASGSAYYDLQVLQTPVLEAFTNNTSNMKTKLVSISRTNVLYMPILKLNKNASANRDNALQYGNSKLFSRDLNTPTATGKDVPEQNKFYIAVDNDTYNAVAQYREDGASVAADNAADHVNLKGLIQGFSNAGSVVLDCIRVDQGLDTTEIPPSLPLDSDLMESAFIVELDYRLGRVKSPNTDAVASVNFIDDDNIASYYLTDNKYVNPLGVPGEQSTTFVGGILSYTKKDLDLAGINMAFEGPRGSTLQLRLQASQDLQSSTYLFEQIGSSEDADATDNILGFPTGGGTGAAADDLLISGKKIYYIDSTIRVVGANTGYRLDIPVRYVKLA